MDQIPEDILRQLRQLISEGLPAKKIAFMMRLDIKVVEAEIERVNTTRERVASDSH